MAFDTTQDAYVQFREIARQRTTPVVAWVGSGLSVPAGLPTWPGLRQELIETAKGKVFTLSSDDREQAHARLTIAASSKEPWLAFELLKRVLGQTTYRETVRRVLGGAATASIPSAYLDLWHLKVSGVLTLNLDRLVTRAFTHLTPGAAPPEFSGHDTANWLHVLRTPHPFIVNLHGTVEDTSSWALSRDELHSLFATPGYDDFVATCLTSRCALFLGISADDLSVGGHLERLARRGIPSGPHFWLTSRADIHTDEWAENLGVRIIRYEAADVDHSAINEFFRDLLGYVPRDDSPEPVTLELPIASAPLLSPSAMLREDAEAIRTALNAKAAELLGTGTEQEYERYRQFCRDYNQAIYRAWYVDVEAGDDLLLGYRLLERAGGGAFGRVFRASAPDGETVAIKLLHEEVRRTPEMLESFRRGVRSMSILTKADLAGIVRYRGASEIPAMVIMDWVEGPNLREAVQAKQLTSWTEILHVALSLTRIIRSAHSLPERVLHRDLRPANIMLRGYWTDAWPVDVVVLDFDLSYHVGSHEKTIDLRGESSNGYLAPEQLQRIPGISTRNAAVDSFGLGMTLYYLVSHRDPYPAEHLHAAWKTTVEAAVLHPLVPDWISLPTRVGRIIESCTRHEQAQRWDIAQVEAELGRLALVLSQGAPNVHSAELLAEELVARTAPTGQYEWNYDSLTSKVVLASGLAMLVSADEARELITLNIDWANSGAASRRGVIKWLPEAMKSACEILKSGGWNLHQHNVGQQTVHITAVAPVSKINRDVDSASRILSRVLEKLTFR